MLIGSLVSLLLHKKIVGLAFDVTPSLMVSFKFIKQTQDPFQTSYQCMYILFHVIKALSGLGLNLQMFSWYFTVELKYYCGCSHPVLNISYIFAHGVHHVALAGLLKVLLRTELYKKDSNV